MTTGDKEQYKFIYTTAKCNTRPRYGNYEKSGRKKSTRGEKQVLFESDKCTSFIFTAIIVLGFC